MSDVPPHAYAGAAAMIRLHDEHLARFVATWRTARARDLALPATEDPDYASLETLLLHVLACARGYMVWICEQLDLPDPGIEPPLAAEELDASADAYLAHVAERWRLPLRAVPEERFGEVYESRWRVPYCIDAMLEHAVMHPIRHTHQLERLMAASG